MILEAIKGVKQIKDNQWSFTISDNDYRKKDPIKIQANSIYVRESARFITEYPFGLIFRCSKSGGPLKLTKIVISGDRNQNGQIRKQVREELYEKFNYLKKSKMRLF